MRKPRFLKNNHDQKLRERCLQYAAQHVNNAHYMAEQYFNYIKTGKLPCEKCKGMGQIPGPNGKYTCPDCNGSAYSPSKSSISHTVTKQPTVSTFHVADR